MTKLKKLLFKPFYWDVVDQINSENLDTNAFEKAGETDHDTNLVIHTTGRTKDNKLVYCEIVGFKPHVYVQFIGLRDSLSLVSENFFNSTKKKYLSMDSYEIVTLNNLYGNITTKLMKIYFRTKEDIMKFSTGVMYSAKTQSFKSSYTCDGALVHEGKIPPEIKYTIERNIKPASWIEVEGFIPEQNIAHADVCMVVDWNKVNPHTSDSIIMTKTAYVAFDIETYSKNHNARQPDPEDPLNKVFQISSTYGKIGEFGSKKYLFTLFRTHKTMLEEKTECKVIECASEKELLLKWTELVRNLNPDFFLGYNILKFDWDYLIKRSKITRCFSEFMSFSRNLDILVSEGKLTWSSSAYSVQEFKFPLVPGRVHLDVLIQVERDYRFPSYKLDYVAEFFLKKKKEDVTHRQLFMLYAVCEALYPIKDTILKKKKKFRKMVRKLMEFRYCTGEVLEFRRRLLKTQTVKELEDRLKEPMTIIGVYCVKDSDLCVDLMNKLNLWIGMEEMSNCMNVPISYIHTRGQQVKVMAQTYQTVREEGMFLPTQPDKQKDRVRGAIVQDALPGDYEDVFTLDYESLYPSSILHGNLCPSTFKTEIKDEEKHLYNQYEWEDHEGCLCPKDKYRKKVDKEKVMCRAHTYYYRKVEWTKEGPKNMGVIPKVVSNLLTQRRAAKKELALAEFKLKMAKGELKEEDIESGLKYFKIPKIKKGNLSEMEMNNLDVTCKVLNAKQLALKISANSVYGGLGAFTSHTTFYPGAATTTYLGRELITIAINYILSLKSTSSKGKKVSCQLIYGDTDSCMIRFLGIENIAETFDLAEIVTKKTNHYLKTKMNGMKEDFFLKVPSTGKSYRIDIFPKENVSELSDKNYSKYMVYHTSPINLQLEKICSRYLLLSKKRYISYIANKKGETKSVDKKGVMLARRDNSQYMRDTYKAVSDCILDKKPEDVVMGVLYDRIDLLFKDRLATRRIPDSHHIIYMSIKKLLDYADYEDRPQIENGKTVVRRVYKTITGGELIGNDTDPNIIKALDEGKIKFGNLPQIILALKMRKRGDIVPANTRLEFLYLKNVDGKKYNHLGEAAEDYVYYRDNKRGVKNSKGELVNLEPDPFIYIDKLVNPMDELITVKFPRKVIPHLVPEEMLDEILDQHPPIKENFLTISKATKKSNLRYKKIANTVLRLEEAGVAKSEKISINRITGKKTKERHYGTATDKQKGYALALMWLWDLIKNKDPLVERLDKETSDLCHRIRSRHILEGLQVKFKNMGITLKARTHYKANRTGERIEASVGGEPVEVYLKKDLILDRYEVDIDPKAKIPKKIFTKGNICKLKEVYPKKGDPILKLGPKAYVCKYDITVSEGVVVKGVSRDMFTPTRIKDKSPMSDILKFRKYYSSVVDEMKEIGKVLGV